MAILEPGIRLAHAAHFHLTLPWSERIRVNSGTVTDAARVWPRDDWRPATADELALLTTGDFSDALTLFNIPVALQDRWWMLQADQDCGAATAQRRMESYFQEVIEYLQFKQMSLPARCTLSVLIHSEGLPSTKPNAAGMTAEPTFAGTIASINLSDADSYLVVSNRRAASADYPLVRVTLQSGEGFWLPKTPIAHDGDTRGRSEIDVQLVLHACQ